MYDSGRFSPSYSLIFIQSEGLGRTFITINLQKHSAIITLFIFHKKKLFCLSNQLRNSSPAACVNNYCNNIDL